MFNSRANNFPGLSAVSSRSCLMFRQPVSPTTTKTSVLLFFFFAREKEASPFFGEHSSPAISLADFSGRFDGELFARAFSYFIYL
jgi:hypothetical protein